MTARQTAAALRLQADIITNAHRKFESSDSFNHNEPVVMFMLQVLKQYADEKVAWALMLEKLSPQLEGVSFQVLDASVDLTPLGIPPLDLN